MWLLKLNYELSSHIESSSLVENYWIEFSCRELDLMFDWYASYEMHSIPQKETMVLESPLEGFMTIVGCCLDMWRHHLSTRACVNEEEYLRTS